MLPLDIPPGTTVTSLLLEVAPAFHRRWVPPEAPSDPLRVTVRVEGAGVWTLHIEGPRLRVEPGETPRPTLWAYTSAKAVERVIADATGPRRMLPKTVPSAAVALSDPRLVKRVAMASGRLELAVLDVDGERLSIVFGFGGAARKPIDPEAPDAVVEASPGTLERMLAGVLPPDAALADGGVRIRGNRFLPMQLALAVAPFYVRAS